MCIINEIYVTYTYGQLTGIVTYHTQYVDTQGHAITLSFQLGAEVAVNAIIGLPTLRKWPGLIDIGKNFFISTSLNLSFPLINKGIDTVLPPTVTFETENFIQPRQVTTAGKIFVNQIDDVNTSIPNSSHLNDIKNLINKETTNIYLQRQIEQTN